MLPPVDFESTASTNFATPAGERAPILTENHEWLQIYCCVGGRTAKFATPESSCYYRAAMQTSDFDYHLPEALIAQSPLAERSQSRLLVLPATGQCSDAQFSELPSLLQPGDLLVWNNTRVLPARLFAHKASGGRVEILIERLLDTPLALAHVRASKAPKPGSLLILENGQVVEMLERRDALFVLRSTTSNWTELLATQGHMPLPPYIDRPDTALDKARYQTVYGRIPGAVAAPTAGLHFDAPLIERLQQQGVGFAEVTLHVGAGTFQPVRVGNLAEHRMHAEWLEVNETCCEQIAQTQRAGGRIVAVGTTTVRSLETAAQKGRLQPYRGETQLFITPGFRFRVVDALITNFHLPQSTLLMLVAAFGGYQSVMQAYAHAVAQGYRFFSYGDAMWLERQENA